MEGKNGGCQSPYQVGPIVAAGDMSQFVEQHVVEFRLSNLRQQCLRENDNWLQESRGQRGNHFIGHKKLRDPRRAGVTQTLLETYSQIRAGGPGALPQAAKTQVAVHDSAE